MFDLIAACLVGAVVLNGAPPLAAKPPQQLAPQSNTLACNSVNTSNNHDLCDRQRPPDQH